MKYTSPRAVCRKLLHMLAAVSILMAGGMHTAAAEDMPAGMRGWWYYISPGEAGFVSDPVTACRLTAKNHMSRELVDIRPYGDTGTFMQCKYLHALQAANDAMGPQWWGLTYLQCTSGYAAKAPGICVKVDEPPVPLSCNAGAPGYTLGNPVTVSTGAKFQSEIDFPGTPAGGLQIARTYRPTSPFLSGQSAGTNWTFSFDRVMKVEESSKEGRPLRLVGTAGDGSYFSFSWNADRAIYESRLDRTATLAALDPRFDEWLLVRDGRADRFRKHLDPSTKVLLLYQLISSQALDGGIQHYTYYPDSQLLKSLADEHGRTLEIGWSGYVIDSIKGEHGSVNYLYDWLELAPDHEISYTRRLIGVEFFDAAGGSTGRKQYHYEDKFHRYLLTGITDENGKRFATYTYDSAARTLSSEHADGANRFTFAYPNDDTRVVTDPLGTQRTIGVRQSGGAGVSTGTSQPGGAGCSASASGITHDGVGNIASKTDFNGVKTCFGYDMTRGLEIRRVSGIGRNDHCPFSDTSAVTGTSLRQIRTNWHPKFALQTAVAEPKRITTYLYNGQRDAAGVVATCGVAVALPNAEPLPRLCKKSVQPTTDPNGTAGFSALAAGAARVWHYTYDADGKLLTQTGPTDGRGRAEKVSRRYYDDTSATHTAGDLASVTNALGETTQYLEYSRAGLPTKVRLPNQLTATLRYEPRQKLSSMELRDNSGVIERSTWEYDLVGNLTRTSDPDGSTVSYGYDDAHRLTHLSDGAGNRINLTLDGAGNAVSREVYGKGGELVHKVKRSYDALNRLQQEQTAVDDAGTRFEYDPNGNLTKIIDELGRATAVQYDAFNRAVRETRSSLAMPVTQSIAYAYNHQDELLSITDPRGLATRYTFDGFGALTSIKSPDTGTTTISLDQAGKVNTVRDARGAVLRYEYDSAGRVTRHGTSQFEYGARGTSSTGKLVKMSDDSGQTAFAYDGFGRLATTSQLVATAYGSRRFGLTYTYGTTGTSTGHLTSITYPSGNRVDIKYGSDGRPSSLSLDAPDKAAPVALIKAITYHPFGKIAGWSWGNSTSSKPNIYARKFDLDGRITGFPLGLAGKNGVARTLSYDTVDRITQTRHAGTATASALDQRYFYDDLDRLTGFDSASGVQGFTYDANGNRTTARFGSNTYKYTFSTTSNRLNSTTGPAPAKIYTYDAAGNLLFDGNIKYSYGANGRLASALAGGITTNYHYNALGQRVAKSANGRVIAQYVYDDQGHLLGEYDSAGLPVQETIYLGDLPLAVVRPGTAVLPLAIYYVYADHLQTPRVVTRASDNSIVWRWDQADPFGLHQPNENPSGVGSFIYNQRFPGQLFDKETNNHYNYYRDYDPQVGRYVQSDPIGLAGGSNTYGYVEGNPIGKADPKGLQVVLPVAPAPLWVPGGVAPTAPGADPYDQPLPGNQYFWPKPIRDFYDMCRRKGIIGEPPPDEDFCRKRRQYCITFCQFELDMPGRRDNFGPHRACVRRCMNAVGCDL